jgi:hypothetical protein
VLAVVWTISFFALRIRKTSTKSESLRAHALPCNLFFRFKAFFISRAHFFFCSFKPFWVSWRFLIFCNKSLLPSMEDDPDPEALLGSDGAGIGDTETEDEAPVPSMEDDPDPSALLGSDGAGIGDTETEDEAPVPSMEDDPDPSALLGSDGAGIGETETEDEAGADSGALSSAPEARPSAASLMAQTHKANQLGVSHRRFSCT